MTEEARRARAGARCTLFPGSTVTHRCCNTALQKGPRKVEPEKTYTSGVGGHRCHNVMWLCVRAAAGHACQGRRREA